MSGAAGVRVQCQKLSLQASMLDTPQGLLLTPKHLHLLPASPAQPRHGPSVLPLASVQPPNGSDLLLPQGRGTAAPPLGKALSAFSQVSPVSG